MNYLSTMTDKQTLVMYSGHPMGLFPSHNDGPRVVITNGMVREKEREIITISESDMYAFSPTLHVSVSGEGISLCVCVYVWITFAIQ